MTCRAACCAGGIWLCVGHVQRVLDASVDVAAWLDADRRDPAGWFTDEVVAHPDFPSGLGTATGVLPRPDGSGRPGCVFVRADHRCALQCAGEALGLAWPGLKPFDCATYPVLRSEGSLRWDRSTGRKAVDCQSGPAAADLPPFYSVFRREIELAIGVDGYRRIADSRRRPGRRAPAARATAQAAAMVPTTDQPVCPPAPPAAQPSLAHDSPSST